MFLRPRRQGRREDRAHLQLLQQPGAAAWLAARPSEALGLHIDAPLFRDPCFLLMRQRPG